jgi:two-component system, OmpR family, sensor histidine kinase CreC
MARRVPLTLRLFVAWAAFVLLGGGYVIRRLQDEIKPAVRQSTEETLVDTANLLAELVAPSLRDGTLQQGALGPLLEAYGRRRPDASIWGLTKDSVSHRIYVTDARGIVLLDSTGKAVGSDYSRWRDVWLTLRGRYGARSTADVPGDDRTTVMYVAAPVRDGDRIVGVVTLAKPNRTLQPYIDAARRRLLVLGAALMAAGLLAGAALSWWLAGAIRRVTRYATDVSQGRQPPVPQLPGGELGDLARAVEDMRTQLEGKAYVERYVQALTHEIKSPLSGIRAAAEVLRGELSPADRARFLGHVETEAQRLQETTERLLHLARVEQRRAIDEPVAVSLAALADEALAAVATRATATGVTLRRSGTADAVVRGDRLLLQLALANLIDNALEFTPRGGHVDLGVDGTTLVVRNDGEAVPDYALPRLTERFYSLPRPGTGRRSTGLGLTLVAEVAALHRGELQVRNVAGGVEARLVLPG